MGKRVGAPVIVGAAGLPEQVTPAAVGLEALDEDHQQAIRELDQNLKRAIATSRDNHVQEGGGAGMHPTLVSMRQMGAEASAGKESLIHGMHPSIARLYAAVTEMAPNVRHAFDFMQTEAALGRMVDAAEAENREREEETGRDAHPTAGQYLMPSHPGLMFLGGAPRQLAHQEPQEQVATVQLTGPKRLASEVRLPQRRQVPGHVRDMLGNLWPLDGLGGLEIVAGPYAHGNSTHNLMVETPQGQKLIAQGINDLEGLEDYQDAVAYAIAVAKGQVKEPSSPALLPDAHSSLGEGCPGKDATEQL